MVGSKIFYQGIEGSFSSKAATIVSPSSVERIGTSRFIDIFEGVKANRNSLGVIPIENSLAGSIHENYDLLARYKPCILREYYLRVAHNLLIKKSEEEAFEVGRLTHVYSHPKALEQCRDFLELHPHIQAVQYSDTAAAARFVARSGEPNIEAIASSAAAELYELAIAQKNIEDSAQNYTRFLVIHQHGAGSRNEVGTKCTLLIQLENSPGSLSRVLTYLANEHYNITKLETRPGGKELPPFSIQFFLDIEKDSSGEFDLSGLDGVTQAVTVFGIYRAETKPPLV